MTYNLVIEPTIAVIQGGDIGIIFRFGAELSFVYDTTIVCQPFLGRQFLAFLIFSLFCFEWFICIAFLSYALLGFSGGIA